ncbi:MAG: alpha/beta hydrolase [Clostridia bacterium]|nr:alpha/beta hydrolase [Clostridia bacterium]
MEFHEFGSPEKPAVLLMHGMMQRWQTEYELLRPLEAHYRLIIPAMDGFYEGSGDFTSFADQAAQIEDYVRRHCGGRLHGAYGASQGGLLLTELITRGHIAIGTVIMDGCYVAHQGRIAGRVTVWMFMRFKRTGRFPALIHVMMRLMGSDAQSMTAAMMQSLYLGASDATIRRNFMENYTYRVRPELAQWPSPVHLWCGSKEPYALQSHREIMRYLPCCTEVVMPGLGHGDFLLKHTAEACSRIRSTIA